MIETDYGTFILKGNEDEVAARWMWAHLLDVSWHGEIELILRIIFKRPPKWVGLKTVEERQALALAELIRVSDRRKHIEKGEYVDE